LKTDLEDAKRASREPMRNTSRNPDSGDFGDKETLVWAKGFARTGEYEEAIL